MHINPKKQWGKSIFTFVSSKWSMSLTNPSQNSSTDQYVGYSTYKEREGGRERERGIYLSNTSTRYIITARVQI